MKPSKIFLFVSILLSECTTKLSAQQLRLELPFHAGKEASVAVQRGILKDTLYHIQLDSKGIGTVDIELARTSVVHIGSLGEHVQYSFVMQPHDQVVLRCKEQYIHRQNTTLLGAPITVQLDAAFTRQAVLKQQQQGLKQLEALYPKATGFGTSLRAEQQRNAVALQAFADSLRHQSGFVSRFIQTRTFMETTLSQAWASDSLKTVTRRFLLQDLDLTMLYGSGMWFDVLNGAIEAYSKGSPYYEKLGEDMVSLMRRTPSDEVAIALADAALSICERFSWPKDQATLLDYLAQSQRVKNPSGKLKRLMAAQNLRIGTKAPDLVLIIHVDSSTAVQHRSRVQSVAQLGGEYSLLVFYQSGCGHCENTLAALSNNYGLLQKRGIKIWALSADTDQVTFQNTARSFPWKDTAYCDLKGFEGINFKNYAVIGTPTMYLLDSKGTILAKMATVEELLLRVNDKQ